MEVLKNLVDDSKITNCTYDENDCNSDHVNDRAAQYDGYVCESDCCNFSNNAYNNAYENYNECSDSAKDR